MKRRRARQMSRYSLFLERFRGRYDLAETYYRRALAAAPDDVDNRGRYAVFLETVRKDYDGADAQYQAALAVAPNHPVLLGNYADFLEQSRGDLDEAERYYRRALEVDPLHPNNLTNYATFLAEVRQEHERAESLYQRALEVAPSHRNALFKYAIFLTDIKREYGDAERLYRVALEAYPDNGAIMANLVGVLFLAGKEIEAQQALDQALSHPVLQRPTADAAECWFYQLLYGASTDRRAALQILRRFIAAGVRSPGFQLWPHVAIARRENHPMADWLGQLAAVLVDGAEPEILNGWEAWTQARTDTLH